MAPSQELGCSGAVAAGGYGAKAEWPGDESLCALGSELAERQQETKALLWELERGASSCPLQPRDLDVVREKLHKLPFRELAEKMSLPVGRVHTPEHRFAGELGAGSGFCPPSSPSTPQDALW